jgi:hypothetical protein
MIERQLLQGSRPEQYSQALVYARTHLSAQTGTREVRFSAEPNILRDCGLDLTLWRKAWCRRILLTDFGVRLPPHFRLGTGPYKYIPNFLHHSAGCERLRQKSQALLQRDALVFWDAGHNHHGQFRALRHYLCGQLKPSHTSITHVYIGEDGVDAGRCAKELERMSTIIGHQHYITRPPQGD